MPGTASAFTLAFLSVASIFPSSAAKKTCNSLSLHVPDNVPDDASSEVDPDFAGLAFEEASWARYALDDDGNTNLFTRNLMDSIYNRTGGKPIIRLGGTSPDYAKYLPGQEEPVLPIAEQNSFQDVGGTTIGPTYWQISKRFPDAKFMVQVPLATTNVSETVAWAQAAAEHIGLDQIHSFQIGNEANFYSKTFKGEGGQLLGPPEYQGHLSNESYTGNFTKYAAAIKEAVDVPDSFFTAFDVGATVNTPWQGAYTFDVETNFDLGINKDNIIKEVSHHYYQNVAGGAEDLADGLMDVQVTHEHFDYLRGHINYLKANHPDIPFVMNEVANSLDPEHSYDYQARLGSALWAVEFYLYGLSIGVARFNYQQLMHSGFDLWLPVASNGLSPQVFSNYYSQPFVADFVGDSGQTRVAKLPIENGEASSNIAAYAAFEDGHAKRIAIANLDYWNKTSSDTERHSAPFMLHLPGNTESVKVTHLSSPMGAGAAADTITYAGSQWTYESLGKEEKGIRDDTETMKVEDGVARIKVPSSEAVIVYL